MSMSAAEAAHWERAQRNADLALRGLPPESEPPSNGANGRHAPEQSDQPPPPNGPEDYDLPAEGRYEPEIPDTGQAATPPPIIEAVSWQWRDPTTIPPRQWLYGHHLIRGFVSATVAPGGLGKSSLTLVDTLAMVTGRHLLGKWVKEPLCVWNWNLEDPEEEIDRRLAAICLQYGIGAADIGGRLHRNSSQSQRCVVAKMLGNTVVILEPVVDALVAEIIAKKIDVLSIDPFVSCHEIPENENGAIDRVIKAWGRVAARSNCAIDLVHHTRKSGEGEITANSARGAGAFVDGCRDVRVLNRMTIEEGKKLDLDNPRLFFRVYSDKANMAPPSDKSDWYKLESIDLGNANDERPSDHVQVVVPWKYPDAFDGVSAADLMAVQKAIAAGEWRADSRAAKWAGEAVATVLKISLENAADKERAKSLLKQWLKTGALKEVKHLDEGRKERGFIEVGQWAV